MALTQSSRVATGDILQTFYNYSTNIARAEFPEENLSMENSVIHQIILQLFPKLVTTYATDNETNSTIILQI
jgi:hypothetical protein